MSPPLPDGLRLASHLSHLPPPVMLDGSDNGLPVVPIGVGVSSIGALHLHGTADVNKVTL